MAFQLVFNGILAIFFIYCFFYIGAIAPEPEPGMMNGAQWPQVLLFLLVLCLALNIIKIIKKTPPAERNFDLLRKLDFKKMITSRLFIGIATLSVYVFVLEYLGFIVSSFLFCAAYTRLLGEKRIGRLALYSLLIVVVLYTVFSWGLDIMLPRGVGIFRNFALMLESI